MLNICISATTLGHSFGAIYDLGYEGPVVPVDQLRIRFPEDNEDKGAILGAKAPIYEKTIHDVIANNPSLAQTDLRRYEEGLKKENERVGALRELFDQLVRVKRLSDRGEEIIMVYVPKSLFNEIHSGRYKISLLDENANRGGYYSPTELALWKEVNPLIAELYHKLMFGTFEGLNKKIRDNNDIIKLGLNQKQVYKHLIYTDIYGVIRDAFKYESDARRQQNREAKSALPNYQKPADYVAPILPVNAFATNGITGAPVQQPQRQQYNRGGYYQPPMQTPYQPANPFNPSSLTGPGNQNNQGNPNSEVPENIAF